MITFSELISEGRGVINATNERHMKNYLMPHQGSGEFSHTTAKEHGELPAGSKVKINKVEWNYPTPKSTQGKWHVEAEDEKGNKHYMPASKLYKPGEETENKGHKYEKDFVERLKSHGVMPKHLAGAGSTAGTDFVAEHKKQGEFHAGTVNGDLLEGETKEGVTAAMGQLTVHHSKEKGWHISDKARALRPKYAAAIEKAGIIDHMNNNIADPEKQEKTASGRAKTITVKHPDLEPAHDYLKDHHVKLLQVGGYGTYRVGEKDVTGHGLPAISGKGKWSIRQKAEKQTNARTVAFQPDGKKGLDKSHVDLDNDEHLHQFKKTLGHTE